MQTGNYQMRSDSQDKYCMGCAYNCAGGCNRILADDEGCMDRIADDIDLDMVSL